MPDSPYDSDDTLVPDTPDGYRDPVAFDYPLPAIVGIVAVLLAGGWVAFGGLLWTIQGPTVLDSVLLIREDASGVSFAVHLRTLAAALVTVGAVTALHELVHGLAYRRLGYRVSYGVAPHMGAFYAATFHQFQTRRDALLVLGAPLVVLDVLALPFLFAPLSLVAFCAFVALLFNTAGAAGDVYALATVGRMPPETLLYDADIRHSYVFYPLDAAA